MKRRLSIRDLAKIAGVSRTTVSLALRDSNLISKKVRTRVQELANKNGYQAHPAITELMRQVRSGKPLPLNETVAFITTFSRSDSWIKENPRAFEIYQGAVEEGKECGIRVETFWAGEGGVNMPQLAKMLYNRGIRGVIIPPMPYPHPPVQMPWNLFTLVSCTPSAKIPHIPIISINHISSISMLLEKLESLGAKKIAIALDNYSDLRLEHGGWSAGTILYKRQGGKARLCLKYIDDYNKMRELSPWLNKVKPDVVVIIGEAFCKWMDATHPKLPYVSLDVGTHEIGEIAGIYQNPSRLGRIAIQYIRQPIRSRIQGFAEYNVSIMLESEFTPGASLKHFSPKISDHK